MRVQSLDQEGPLAKNMTACSALGFSPRKSPWSLGLQTIGSQGQASLKRLSAQAHTSKEAMLEGEH